jgi:hypothetical protein
MSYLASEHDRDKAELFARDAEDVRPVNRTEAIHELGGKNTSYRETIVAFSENECRALEERAKGDKEAAQRMAAHGIGERLSEGKPYVVALHEEGNRWHLHVAVKDGERPELYGPRGEAQKVFEDYWRSSQPRPRIQDWDSHTRARGLQAEIRNLGQDLRRLERDRFEAVRQAKGAEAKLQVASHFVNKEQELIELRHNQEKKAIEARHTSRGSLGSWDQKVDLERAQIRRAGAENRIQRREDKLRERLENWRRPDTRFTRKTDRAFAQGRERLVQAVGRAANTAGRAASTAAKSIAETWLPTAAKVLSQVASKSAISSIKMASSLALSATGAGKALSIALKATDLAKCLAKAASNQIMEIER